MDKGPNFLKAAQEYVNSELQGLQEILAELRDKVRSEIGTDETAMPNKRARRENIRLRTEQLTTIASTIAQIKLNTMIAATQAEALALAAVRGKVAARPTAGIKSNVDDDAVIRVSKADQHAAKKPFQ